MPFGLMPLCRMCGGPVAGRASVACPGCLPVHLGDRQGVEHGYGEEFDRLVAYLWNCGFSPSPREQLVSVIERAHRASVPPPQAMDRTETIAWWLGKMRAEVDLRTLAFETHRVIQAATGGRVPSNVVTVVLTFANGERETFAAARSSLAEDIEGVLQWIEAELLEAKGGLTPVEDGESFSDATPDVAEYVIGYRIWPVRNANLAAAGWGEAGDDWDGGEEVRAACRRDKPSWAGKNFGPLPRHHAPQVDCSCGFHAYYSVEGAMKSFYVGKGIIGAVACRGVLVPYDDGFRAEFAKPVVLGYLPKREVSIWADALGIDDPERTRRFEEEEAREIGRKFGIPVVPLIDLPVEALKHGEHLDKQFYA